MRRGALVLALTLAAGLTAGVRPGVEPASAGVVHKVTATSTKVRLVGHGYGHGHGMSQHGAQGAATGTWGGGGKTKLSWQQIVGFYYPGTTLSSISTLYPRVLITAHKESNLTVGPRTGLTARDDTGGVSWKLPTDKDAQLWRLTWSGTTTYLSLKKSDGVWYRWKTFPGNGSFHANGQPVRMYYAGTSHRFRGRLMAVSPTAGSSTRDVINRVAMEQYLYGVVPGEMPSTWHPNALRAQAVAARSFAANALLGKTGYYQLQDTVNSQVYLGYDAERSTSNAAVDYTKGKALLYDGKPVFAQFCSSSGGWLDAGSQPYLVAKADPYDNYPGNPQHSWDTASSTVPDITVVALEKAVPEIGDLRSIEVRTRDGNGEWGGRVETIRFTGLKNGKAVAVTISGTSLRSRIGPAVLKSTYFAVKSVS